MNREPRIFETLWFTWTFRGAVLSFFGLFTLIGVFVFPNWQTYLLVGVGFLLSAAWWFLQAHRWAAFGRERRQSGASPEAAEQGFDSVGWGKHSDQ